MSGRFVFESAQKSMKPQQNDTPVLKHSAALMTHLVCYFWSVAHFRQGKATTIDLFEQFYSKINCMGWCSVLGCHTI